jgi:hypothetical protein
MASYISDAHSIMVVLSMLLLASNPWEAAMQSSVAGSTRLLRIAGEGSSHPLHTCLPLEAEARACAGKTAALEHQGVQPYCIIPSYVYHTV